MIPLPKRTIRNRHQRISCAGSSHGFWDISDERLRWNISVSQIQLHRPKYAGRIRLLKDKSFTNYSRNSCFEDIRSQPFEGWLP